MSIRGPDVVLWELITVLQKNIANNIIIIERKKCPANTYMQANLMGAWMLDWGLPPRDRGILNYVLDKPFPYSYRHNTKSCCGVLSRPYNVNTAIGT